MIETALFIIAFYAWRAAAHIKRAADALALLYYLAKSQTEETEHEHEQKTIQYIN